MAKWRPEMITKALEYAKTGNTRAQISNNLGISNETLCQWMNNKPEFSEAIKKGEEMAISLVENKLYQRATGYEAEETQTVVLAEQTKGEEPKPVRVLRVTKTKKQIAPDTVAQIFYLKNKKPAEYKDRKEVEHSGNIGQEIDEEHLTERINELLKLRKQDEKRK